MSTLREQLEKISSDNFVTVDKLLDAEFLAELDYNNLDDELELKQRMESHYDIFKKDSSRDIENLYFELCYTNKNHKRLKRFVIYFLTPIAVISFMYMFYQIL